jgi:hypothetical protein
MKKWIQIDERSQQVGGRISFLFLTLTQIGLLVLIFYQRYLLIRPPSYYNDLALVAGFSLLGYWAFSLFFGGFLPLIRPIMLLVSYLILAAGIGIPYTIIRGIPAAGELQARLLVILGAPAVLIGFYALVAYLGKTRLDRLSSIPDDSGTVPDQGNGNPK